jgi:lysozyme
MNNFTYDGAGLAVTESGEGCRLVPYQDQAGVWTDGFGNTTNVVPGKLITLEKATADLQNNILFAATAVNRLVTVELTQAEFDALTDFTFNVGVTAFTKSTLLKLLNKGNYTGAALEFPKWDLCAGQVNRGLLNRRAAEQDEFDSNNLDGEK